MKKYLTLKNLGWTLTTLASILIFTSGAQKAIATQEMVGNFTYLKLLPYLTLVGVLEITGAFLLVFNRTSIYGAALIGSLMSAAVVIHLSVLGTSPLVPIVIGLLAWVGYSLRNFAVQKA
jgi:hypothetical protein